MATLAALEDQVRDKLGLAATDTPPTDSEIDQWIVDGQNEIVNMVVDDALTTMIVEDSLDGNLNRDVGFTSGSPSLTSEPYRILAVKIKELGGSLESAILVSSEIMDIIDDGSDSIYSTSGKFYAIYESKIRLSQAGKSEAGSVVVRYIKIPQKTRTTECDLPTSLEPLVVDYAVAEAKKQIEEYNDAQAIMQGFYQKIGVINKRYGGIHEVEEE